MNQTMRFRSIYSCVIFLIAINLGGAKTQAKEKEPSESRPNILWLSCEDISDHLGCYGFENANTPNLDRFAKQGVIYDNAYVTAGVCAPCRSAVITGMYQTSIGTHHMRCTATLPNHIKPFTHYLRSAGYYCTNNSKQDYQFKTPKGTWDASSGKAHWKNCPKDQPFFSVFNFVGCHESGIENDSKYKKVTQGQTPIDRNFAAKTLPPYYPNTEVTREDWGRYYDVIAAMDRWVGKHLKDLEEAGLADNTIVLYWSDHGVGLPRAKRWLYDSGMKVPMILRVPEKYRKELLSGEENSRTKRLVSLVDLAPTTLKIAGIEKPKHMQGQSFLGRDSVPRKYVFGARDRMDERYDIIRAVRNERYKYIRNYQPSKPYYQYMNTPEKGRTMREIRRVSNEKPTDAVAKFLSKSKPTVELYDTVADPHELNNLAESESHQEIRKELELAHQKWVRQTRDLGLIPEAIIRKLSKELGSDYAILNGPNSEDLLLQIQNAATLVDSESESKKDRLAKLLKLSKSKHSAVRYWATVGLGSCIPFENDQSIVQQLGQDASESVQIEAARLMLGWKENRRDGLRILAKVLDDGSQWARVHAANVLDELDEQARPILATMKKNLSYRKGFVADGKYTVRVLNRAINELEGTNNRVK